MAIETKIEPIDLPFEAAIAYFRKKLNLPTRAWNDIWEGMHTRSFVVAGAMKEDLLEDLRQAIDKSISEGTTLKEFQKDFDKTVSKHGWSYKGGRGWRTRVILETNIRTAYAAGRWKQMTDPEVLKLRPYLMYRHGDSASPRAEHLAWDKLVLPADDPWWKTHYPPNGWGCKCRAFSVGLRDLARMGLSVQNSPQIEYYEWFDRKTKKTHQVPVGIDPGWAYNVGEAAYGDVKT